MCFMCVYVLGLLSSGTYCFTTLPLQYKWSLCESGLCYCTDCVESMKVCEPTSCQTVIMWCIVAYPASGILMAVPALCFWRMVDGLLVKRRRR